MKEISLNGLKSFCFVLISEAAHAREGLKRSEGPHFIFVNKSQNVKQNMKSEEKETIFQVSKAFCEFFSHKKGKKSSRHSLLCTHSMEKIKNLLENIP